MRALDPDQLQAVESLEGPLLIVAGPGTGKTRTLTHRIAHLIAERRVEPERCLAVTFSRRAASEMAERLATLSPEAGRAPVFTFHGLGLHLLREQAEAAGLPPGFRVALPAERVEIVREAFALTATQAERRLEEIGEHRRLGTRTGDAAVYEEALRTRNLLDFDDLILKPLALLRDQPALRDHYRERFRWISIDEYQDIDPLQYALIRELAPPDANLCAIGDPDQSIYGFRGADVGFFLRFQEDFPGARVVHLTRNYRSSSVIVEAAKQAIRPASLVPDRRLVAVSGGGGRIVVQPAASEKAEAELVVHTLERLVGGTSSFSFDSGRVRSGDDEALSFADVAVLYRTEAQSAALTEALGRAGIPFQKRSHRPLADQPGVRVVVPAMQRLALEGGGVVESLLDRAAEDHPAAADLLRPLAIQCGEDLDSFLAAIAGGAEVDAWDPRAEGVALLTLHASKGLEFPVVFLVGCEDGMLPLTWPGAEPGDRAEERRLFFVGITRARSRLFLFHSRRRTVRGQAAEARPTPFLDDLGEELLERRALPDLGPRAPRQLSLI